MSPFESTTLGVARRPGEQLTARFQQGICEKLRWRHHARVRAHGAAHQLLVRAADSYQPSGRSRTNASECEGPRSMGTFSDRQRSERLWSWPPLFLCRCLNAISPRRQPRRRRPARKSRRLRHGPRRRRRWDCPDSLPAGCSFAVSSAGGSKASPAARSGRTTATATCSIASASTSTVAPSDVAKFVVQVQDARVFDKTTGGSAVPFRDTIDLRMAYGEFGGARNMVRAGRQELAFGEQRLIGHLNWVEQRALLRRRSRDDRAQGRSSSTSFATSVVTIQPDALRQERQRQPALRLLRVGTTRVIPNATVEPYLFWRQSEGLTLETGGLGDIHQATIGTRVVGKLPADFDYGVEMAAQTGSVATDDAARVGRTLGGRARRSPARRPSRGRSSSSTTPRATAIRRTASAARSTSSIRPATTSSASPIRWDGGTSITCAAASS